MNFAIIGATGNVGRKTIDILEKSKLKNRQLFIAYKMKSEKKYLLKKKKLKLSH